jgi:hypothetical protein
LQLGANSGKMANVSHILKENLYTNCKLLSPDNILMCRIGIKHINYYLSKGLAEIVEGDEESPQAIRLKFQPKGLGRSDYAFYTEPIENCCVVCGETKYLTRHHCVPWCFTKYMPVKYKSNMAHDVLLVCRSCHNRYEQFANEEKLKFINIENIKNNPEVKAAGAAKTLKKYGAMMPEHKVQEFRNVLVEYCNTDNITDEIIDQFTNSWCPGIVRFHWKEFTENLEDIDGFRKFWREHFVKTMNPQFMPKHWSVDGFEASKTERTIVRL